MKNDKTKADMTRLKKLGKTDMRAIAGGQMGYSVLGNGNSNMVAVSVGNDINLWIDSDSLETLEKTLRNLPADTDMNIVREALTKAGVTGGFYHDDLRCSLD